MSTLKTSDASSEQTAQSSTRTRHRSGRRVVRQAGAAGVKMPMKIHEEGRCEPQEVTSNDSPVSQKKTVESHRVLLATELFSDRGLTREMPTVEKSTQEEHSESTETARYQFVHHPMTSLLFQEPVLPAPHADHSDEKDKDESALSSSDRIHTRRRKRIRSNHASSVEQSETATVTETASEEIHEDSEVVDFTKKRVRRRRRLNAEERAAVAEIKQIEEDIKQKQQQNDQDDKSVDVSSDESESDQLHLSGTTILSRRHRSSKHSSSTLVAAKRKREQQYIEKIKDVEGSTRLEAKRQRHRDNRRERSRQVLITEQDFLARRENVDRQMIVRERGRHTQISVIEDNILVEHYVSDIDEVSTVGNIYLGRVQNVLPSMEAAFVNIGEARNGVLYAGEVNWDATQLEGHPRRIELVYHSGDPILVQVTKDPIGHKGARLTAQVTLAGRYIVLVPLGGMTGFSRKLSERERARLRGIIQNIVDKNIGVIIRTAAEGASEEAIAKDYQMLITQWNNVLKQYSEFKDSHRPRLLRGEPDVAIRVVRDTFNDDFKQLIVEGENVYDRIQDYLSMMSPDLVKRLHYWDPAEHAGQDVFDRWKIDGQLRKGMERQVYLPSGGSLVIDRTEAMTTIDVNTGRFIGKGKSLEEAVTRCNLEAAEEIVRQLRLRDIGGMIMIDFVDMVLESNRNLVWHRLVECLSRDHTKHQVAEVTSLGLVQMTRKRVGQGLVEAFSEECPLCHGRGFLIHEEPTIDSTAADPYEVKGGDPFEVSRGKRVAKQLGEAYDVSSSMNSSRVVKEKLAAIAAAATRIDEERKASLRITEER
ncbi:MAG: Rne/Rng family ribonuclease [Aeriscardovia sp.]|nr:Rne/Rng family ribonuclease [Aeriscardovia sp.]